MVYALLLARIERDVEAERTAIRMAVAVSGGKAPLPSYEERVAEFDAALFADPTRLDERDELLRELGVR